MSTLNHVENVAAASNPHIDDLPRKEPLSRAVEQSLRASVWTSVVFIDLDNFKAVNDTRGHQAGDQCLQTVVTIILEAIEGKGSLYRYGGDEFVVLLPNFTITEGAATAERLRQSILNANPGGAIRVTASIGVAAAETAKMDAGALIKLGDQAMYKSKSGGKNRVSNGTSDNTTQQGPDPAVTRQLELTIEELGDNARWSGTYAATLATKHLERLIDQVEQHPENGHFRSIEPDLKMVMVLARAQTAMTGADLDRHQRENYRPHAENLKNKLESIKHRLIHNI